MLDVVSDTVPVLRCEGVSKTFGGHRALDRASLSIAPGEVHGLLGQNGSGKSTLIKVLAGFHPPDPGGSLWVNGAEVELTQAALAALPISFVHQHLGLIPSLTVTENMLIKDLALENRLAVNWRRETRRVGELLARYDVDVDPSVEVARLSPVQRALIAIVRAAAEVIERRAGGGGLLILDEPTPFLPQRDVEQLFGLVRTVVRAGSSVIFVSHDVDEVMEITDKATILRNGAVAARLTTAEAAREDFITAIVGRKLELAAPPANLPPQRSERLAVRGLGGTTVRDIDFSVASGEVLGLTGLIGSGYDEVPYLIYGAKPGRGTLVLDGRELAVPDMSPAASIDAGIALIPSDRPKAGAIGALPITDNITMPRLGRDLGTWWLRRRAMRGSARALMAEYDVRPAGDPALPMASLSGGNAQKVVLAKWLQMNPGLVLLDEPTQGVDVGARQTVFTRIQHIAAGGAAVACASSDYEQLAAICHRVLIFSRGRIVRSLEGGEIDKQSIAEASLNASTL
ncbi:sugar ABC transporter ATP-binding protein [Salipiger sp. H15]|uniref:Sugar ABC transporter ATP-binding protein n=1 Tax=Alloyangia sp. H15 TaxID=3029062 RepID=A0AAU8AMM0_9RHOB